MPNPNGTQPSAASARLPVSTSSTPQPTSTDSAARRECRSDSAAATSDSAATATMVRLNASRNASAEPGVSTADATAIASTSQRPMSSARLRRGQCCGNSMKRCRNDVAKNAASAPGMVHGNIAVGSSSRMNGTRANRKSLRAIHRMLNTRNNE